MVPVCLAAQRYDFLRKSLPLLRHFAKIRGSALALPRKGSPREVSVARVRTGVVLVNPVAARVIPVAAIVSPVAAIVFPVAAFVFSIAALV